MASTRPTRAPGERPLYSIPEIASYLQVSPFTLRSWVVGRHYPTTAGARTFRPLIHRPVSQDPRLSFTNLVEAHTLAALRMVHGVEMRAVRTALSFAEKKLSIGRLLARKELETDGKSIFLKHLGQALNLSESGQYVAEKLLQQALTRVVHDDEGWAVRLFPRLALDEASRRIAIDPEVSFGRPYVAGRGVSVAALRERFNAHESISVLADDYGLEAEDVEAAISFAA